MTNSTNIFELATRAKLRFASSKGGLSVEQLWDLPLKASDGFDLDEIAKAANRAVVATAEESFVETVAPANTMAKLTLDVVLHVIQVKLAEREAAKNAASRARERQILTDILADKETAELRELSPAQLRARIQALN